MLLVLSVMIFLTFSLTNLTGNLYAEESEVNNAQGFTGNPNATILVGCGGAILKYAPTGKITWKYTKNVGNMGDCTVLKNGNILFADGDAVEEITPDGNVIFQYSPDDGKKDGIFSAQRLENGNTVIGYNSQNKVLEVNSSGKVVHEMTCQFLDKIGSHNNMRIVRKSDRGTYFVAHKKKGVIAEYSSDGTILSKKAMPGKEVYGLFLLPDQAVLGAFLDCVVLFNKEGTIIWRCNKEDLPELDLTWLCSLWVRPNGNIVVGNYAANRGNRHAVCMFEITREKKVVWSYKDSTAPGSFLGINILEP